ncbi:MAG: hypothetical protein SFY56_15205 [Bacteroidota bacterium]|nr:hypothetical protein [Bacteroidota bacterium]
MIKAGSQPLSNIQMELLKLYSTGISDENLQDIKKIISQFLFDKSINEADKLWDEKKYTPETINKWLNKD